MARFGVLLGKVYLALVLGIVLIVVPIWLIQVSDTRGWPRWWIPAGRQIGGGLMIVAVGVWVYCSLTFSREGRGSLFVVDPPKQLVISGLYAYSRNPVYVAHGAFLLGLFLRLGHPALLIYAVGVMALICATVVLWEEPGLRERFGEDYERYTQTVPRWLLALPAAMRRRGNG